MEQQKLIRLYEAFSIRIKMTERADDMYLLGGWNDSDVLFFLATFTVCFFIAWPRVRGSAVSRWV
jgi:hypothetical protein